MTRTQGVDWAKYQGNGGYWGTAGDTFAICQVGGTYGGALSIQATYAAQVRAVRALGRHAHTYIWYQVSGSQSIAKACLDAMLPRITAPKGSIVALDYEAGASGSKTANTNAILYGMRRIKTAGYTPMYYSYKPYTLAHVDYQAILREFPASLWIAAYPDYAVRTEPLWSVFPSMDGVAIWQFTSTYRNGGLDGNVDLTGITASGYTKTADKAKPKEADDMPKAQARDASLAGIAYIRADTPVYSDATLTHKTKTVLAKGKAYKVFDTHGTVYGVGGKQYIGGPGVLFAPNPLKAKGQDIPGTVVATGAAKVPLYDGAGKQIGTRGIDHWHAFKVSVDGKLVNVGGDQWFKIADVGVMM